MEPSTATLIVGLAGITATAATSALGLYFTAKARSASLREKLYAKQLELAAKLIHKQERFRVFATVLGGPQSAFVDRARKDMTACVKDHSELVEEAAVIFPTDTWIAAKQLGNLMADLATQFDRNAKIEQSQLENISVAAAKVALLARAMLGVDELTDDSLRIFSSVKAFQRLAKIKPEALKSSSRQAKTSKEPT